MNDENPIQEIWRIREELSAAEGYDVHRLFDRLRQEEKQYASRLVHSVPRKPDAPPATVLRETPPTGH